MFDRTQAPNWSPVVPEIGHADHRPFEGEDTLTVLDRLARFVPSAGGGEQEDPGRGNPWADPFAETTWEAGDTAHGSFVKVDPGSLSDVPRLRVFVHGWLRGGLPSSRRSVAINGRLARAWDDDVTNQYGTTPLSLYSPLMAAMAKADPECAVLWFSWADQAATDGSLFAARDSLRHAPINGRRLAAALSHAIWGGADSRHESGPDVHLIGHSHGCVVAVNAALAMPVPPTQLTVLDCPEDWVSRTGGAAGLLNETLPRLHPGRRPGTTFVDSYRTMFGRSYHDRPGLGGVVDVRVTPVVGPEALDEAAAQAHQYAVSFYRKTIEDLTSMSGWAWSPLSGRDPQSLGSAYLVTPGGHLRVLRRWTERSAEAPHHVISDLRVPSERLTADCPDLDVLTELPEDALFVEFDLSFAGCDAQAHVDVAFNGVLAFTSYARAPVPTTGRFIRATPGRAVLQFRLVGAGAEGSVMISRIRVARDSSADRNADDRSAMLRAATLGAIAGSAATTGAVMASWGVRRAVARIRS